ILAPLAETVRRWHQLSQLSVWPFWLDDYFMGALLLYGAWRTSKDIRSGRRFLAGAWGFTCGLAYLSFFRQVQRLHVPDAAPIPSVWVAVIKGVGLALAILALVGSLKRQREDSNEPQIARAKTAGA